MPFYSVSTASNCKLDKPQISKTHTEWEWSDDMDKCDSFRIISTLNLNSQTKKKTAACGWRQITVFNVFN